MPLATLRDVFLNCHENMDIILLNSHDVGESYAVL